MKKLGIAQLLNIADNFDVFASDQVAAKRWQNTQKAKRDCDIRAEVWRDAATIIRAVNLCSVNGCDKPIESKGLCCRHYSRWRRYGDPLKGGTVIGAAATWLMQHKNFVGTECLIWPFCRTESGYGKITNNGLTRRVPRVMCEHRHGPPPTSKHEAAHLCGKGHLGCVNPKHLDWKTPEANRVDQLIHGTFHRARRVRGLARQHQVTP